MLLRGHECALWLSRSYRRASAGKGTGDPEGDTDISVEGRRPPRRDMRRNSRGVMSANWVTPWTAVARGLLRSLLSLLRACARDSVLWNTRKRRSSSATVLLFAPYDVVDPISFRRRIFIK